MEYKMRGNDIINKNSHKIGAVRGNDILNEHSHKIGSVRGNDILNENSHKIGAVRGNDILNEHSSKIATLDVAKRTIENLPLGTMGAAIWMLLDKLK